MALTSVEDVWGIGRRISKKLNSMGINTALDLAESSLWVIRKHFNVVLERTVRELRGEQCLELEEFSPTKQQIICSRSFGHRITQYSDMHQAICAYAERASENYVVSASFVVSLAFFFVQAHMQITKYTMGIKHP